MKSIFRSFFLIILTGLLISNCKNGEDQNKLKSTTSHAAKISTPSIVLNGPLRSDVLTEEEQRNMTPDSIIHILAEGNKRFTINKITAMDYTAMARKSATGQFPEAVIITCMDSRIPVEEVFDRGIGDIFVERVAGNIIDEDLLGSLEYACKLAGSKVILVLGHESCGAVKAAIDNEELGNLTTLLAKIKPAINQTQSFKGAKTAANPVFVEQVAKNNVKNTIELIKKNSPLLKQMADQHQIKIIGGYYHISTGQVSLL